MFESKAADIANYAWASYGENGKISNELGNTDGITKVVLGSIDTAANPAKTLVDDSVTDGMGQTDRPDSLELGVIYLMPVDATVNTTFTYSGIVVTNEAASSFNLAEQTVVIGDGGSGVNSETPTPTTHGNEAVYLTSEAITASEASIAKYGSDYSTDANATVLKLTIYADMANVDDASIQSITGAELDFNIDWTQFKEFDYGNNGSAKFETNKADISDYVWAAYTASGKVSNEVGNTEGLTKIVLGSINTSNSPVKTLVDAVTTDGIGQTDLPSKIALGSIYLTPAVNVDTISFDYSATVVTNEAADNFNIASQNVAFGAPADDGSANTPPVANNDTYTIDQGDTVTLTTLANDTDAEDGNGTNAFDKEDITVVTDFANGSVQNGVYTPDAGFVGTDTRTYTVTDSDGAVSNEATVSVTVNATNDNQQSDVPTTHGNEAIYLVSEAITAQQASSENYNGTDYSQDPNQEVIKLTIYADMDNVSDTNVQSITGAEIDFNIDWTQFKEFDYGNNGSAKFETNKADISDYVWAAYTASGKVSNEVGNTEGLTKIVLGSINTSNSPVKTLVDAVTTDGIGQTDLPSKIALGSIYLTPAVDVDTISFDYSATVVTNEAADNFNIASQNVAFGTPADSVDNGDNQAFDPTNYNFTDGQNDSTTLVNSAFENYGVYPQGLVATNTADEANKIDEWVITATSFMSDNTTIASDINIKVYVDFSQEDQDIFNVVYSTGVESLTDNIPGMDVNGFTNIISSSYMLHDDTGSADGGTNNEPFDPMQEYANNAVKGFFEDMGIEVSGLSVDFDSNDTTNTDTITITTSNIGTIKLVFVDGDIVESESSGIPSEIPVDAIQQWYEYSDPEKDNEYEVRAVEELLNIMGVTHFEKLEADVEPREDGSDELNIKLDAIELGGFTKYAVDMSFVFKDGKVTDKSGVPSEFDNFITNTQLEIWYENSNPDKQKEQDKLNDGYYDDKQGGGDLEYVNTWSWTDGEGVTWTVVDKEVDGTWTSTETGSNGDVRTHTSNWDHATQTNTHTETYVSTSKGLDYTRVEKSSPDGTTNTYTGTTDHIGWQHLNQVYTNVNVVEKLDMYWNIVSISGSATDADGNDVVISYNADNYEILIDGESVYNNFGFDDHFKEQNEYEWTDDWSGITWKVVEQDVNGTWTTTETAYKDGVATGEVREFTSNWDNSTETNTWSEHYTNTEKGIDFTRTEESSPSGVSITTTGANDHVGWMYLGDVYTNLNVVETMDGNWNTTDISGSGTNEDGEAVTFSWDSATWQLLVDGSPVDAGHYEDPYANNEPQDWSNEWEWQDGDGITWKVVDKQEGDVWTSTETGYKDDIATGDVRIHKSEWDNETKTNTWSESVTNISKGIDFTMTEVSSDGTDESGNWVNNSTMTVTGATDHIGWIPLNSVYTDVEVTETRVNWQTTALSGIGKDANGNEVEFGMQADEWGGYQLTIDGEVYDPWAMPGDPQQPGGDTGGDYHPPKQDSWENEFEWTDWDGSIWKVVEKEEDGVFSATETNQTSGDVRKFTNEWNDDGTSIFTEEFTSADGKVDFKRVETIDNNGTYDNWDDDVITLVITGKDDHIGWDYLGESYTDMNVTVVRDGNWNTQSVKGTGKDSDGNTVEFGYDDGNITIDGDEIGDKHYGDDDKRDDNFQNEWSYVDGNGIEWTVTDSQDGDWWESVEISTNGDKRVNKSKWDADGDDDNDDGVVDVATGDYGAYSKFVSKYVSADKSINFKMVEKYYENFKDQDTTLSVLIVTGDSDHLGWDYLGDVYTDIDFKIVRDGDWKIKKIVSATDDDINASAVNADGETVYFYKNNNEIFVTTSEDLSGGRSIYEVNNDFFDFGDDDFDMDSGKWEYEFVNENNHNVSVVDESVATDVITIKADDYNSTGTALNIVMVFDADNNNDLISVTGLPQGVTGLSESDVSTWYKDNIPGFEPTGGWGVADEDEQEQSFVNTKVSEYLNSVGVNTTNLTTEFDIKDTWLTTETVKNSSGDIVEIIVRSRTQTIDSESEREERFESQEQYESGTPAIWFERVMSFDENSDGGYSMTQEVVSSKGENFVKTETYNEDGTTTIVTKGDMFFDGLQLLDDGSKGILVTGAEITETLDRNWQHIDFSGTSDLPAIYVGNTDGDDLTVLITMEGLSNYGEPQLRFTVVDASGVVVGEKTNYEKEVFDMLSEYVLQDTDDAYVTSRTGWEWSETGFTVDSDTKTTFTGEYVENADVTHNITVVETKSANNDGFLENLEHHITTTRDEDYTVVFKSVYAGEPKYHGREGVEITFSGTKKYVGE